MNQLNRVLAINLLVDDDLNGWYDRDDQADYFSYLLRTGIKGYDDYTDAELGDELHDRGLDEQYAEENTK